MVKFLKIKWLGHASWKINSGGKVIYIDPYEGEYDDPADLILSTHHHDDHCKQDKIEQVRTDDTTVVATPMCGEKLGINVESLKPGESFTLGDITVNAVEAYNVKRFRSPGNPFHPKGVGVGYILHAEGKKVYHVGDSDVIDEMRDLPDIDLMLVPSGGTYTMDNPDAVEAVLLVKPKQAIPMHIWDTDPTEFKEGVESTSSTKVTLLKSGETLSL